MKIGVISNHFSFPPINYLLSSHLIAGFAVSEIATPASQNIKLISETFHLPFNILQKETLSEDITYWLSDIKADLVFIFSFPFKIPETVLNIPAYGFINFHPGILPSYRGPVPLFWQIKNGISETGITAHKLDKNFDSGPILHIEKEYIAPADTFGTLSKKLVNTLLKCVTNVVVLIDKNNPDSLPFIQQSEKKSSYFGKPQEKDLLIDWDKQSALSIYNLVRAANPKYHGASTFFKDFPIKFLQISIQPETSDLQPGLIVDSENGIKVVTIDNKIISVDIIYTMEGYFSGASFQKLFNVHQGDLFGKPKI